MQPPVLLFLVLYHRLYQQISLLFYSFLELHPTLSEKCFCHKFSFFNGFTQTSNPRNSKNLLSVTKLFWHFNTSISNYIVNRIFRVFLVLILHFQPLLFHFSKINLESDQCLLLIIFDMFIFFSARFLIMCKPRTGQPTSIGILWKWAQDCHIRQTVYLPGQPAPYNQLLIQPLLLFPECYLAKRFEARVLKF